MKIITKFNSIESFETERLLAVRLTPLDLEKFKLMDADANVMITLGGVRSAEQAKQRLDWNLQKWREYGFGIWMFYLKGKNEWIGRGGLRHANINGYDEVEIAYSLMPTFWNKGYATEITEACIEVAFEVLHLKNVACFALTTNKSSQKVMEKAGMQYERDIVINYEGVEYPHVLYRIEPKT